MSGGVSSFLTGTVGLLLALAAALALTLGRSPVSPAAVTRIRFFAGVGLLLQAAHFSEEFAGGFHRLFPETLGLEPWPPELFATFNLAWLAAWALSIAALARLPRISAVPLWFLGIAAVLNGLAHPVLALLGGGYFPGLWTALLLGVAGLVLLRELVAATRGQAAAR